MDEQRVREIVKEEIDKYMSDEAAKTEQMLCAVSRLVKEVRTMCPRLIKATA